MKCQHCNNEITGKPKARRFKKWVSWGPVNATNHTLHFHKDCFPTYMTERAKWYSVLDETLNSCKYFVRTDGQVGYYERDGRRCPIAVEGWRNGDEFVHTPGIKEWLAENGWTNTWYEPRDDLREFY